MHSILLQRYVLKNKMNILLKYITQNKPPNKTRTSLLYKKKYHSTENTLLILHEVIKARN